VRSSKVLLSGFYGLLALLCTHGAFAGPANCQSPEIGSAAAPRFSPPLSAVVVATGRLPFYSAPNPLCPIAGTFIIPKDEVVVYARTNDGWSSVMYMGGNYEQGWVRSARLKLGGTMGPSQ